MAGILILLLISFVLFFLLTRIVWVRIIKGNSFKIEIHLPILAIHLIKRNSDKDKKSNINDTNLSFLGYIRILTHIANKIQGAKISVKAIALPIKSKDFDKTAILRPLRQQVLLYGIIAYLRTKTEKLTLEDNAIILSPDIDVLHCYVTLKIRLYKLIYGFIAITQAMRDEKKRRRGKRLVRE